MTFFESIKTVFRKYAEFGGRATRPEFWWFTLFSFLVASALSALLPNTWSPGMWGGGMWGGGMSDAYLSLAAAPALNLSGFWGVAVLLPSLAVTVRRLRDTGREWTNIFWILLPIAGLIVLIVFLSEASRTNAVVAPAAPAAPAAPVAPKAPAKRATAAKPPAKKN